MIGAGYNYDRLAAEDAARYSTGKYQREIIITHQDTGSRWAIEVDSQGLFKTAKIYVGRGTT